MSRSDDALDSSRADLAEAQSQLELGRVQYAALLADRDKQHDRWVMLSARLIDAESERDAALDHLDTALYLVPFSDRDDDQYRAAAAFRDARRAG